MRCLWKILHAVKSFVAAFEISSRLVFWIFFNWTSKLIKFSNNQGVKPFACKEQGCNRKFTIRPDLNDHIRKCHTGERPYHCLICGKRFLTGSVFYQHRLIHRGERRYGCDSCGKRFYRADALKNHQRIHTGGFYSIFSWKSTVKFVSPGEKPFGCLYCQKHFRQRGDRDKHIKARHSSLNANERIMMQMRNLQMNGGNIPGLSDDLVYIGNLAFPGSMFKPLVNDVDGGGDDPEKKKDWFFIKIIFIDIFKTFCRSYYLPIVFTIILSK